MIRHVQADERRAAVFRDHAVARRQQLGLRREVLAVKRPVGVIPQLFPALVEAVGGREERVRISGMDEHR